MHQRQKFTILDINFVIKTLIKKNKKKRIKKKKDFHLREDDSFVEIASTNFFCSICVET